MDGTFIRESKNWCKSIVEIDASQLYLFSMCQAMTTGLYTKWELVSESSKFKPRQNKKRCFENIVMSYSRRVKLQCKVESFYTRGTQKKMMHTVLMAFVDILT